MNARKPCSREALRPVGDALKLPPELQHSGGNPISMPSASAGFHFGAPVFGGCFCVIPPSLSIMGQPSLPIIS